MSVRVSIHAPAAPEALAVIDAGLDEYNIAGAPLNDVRPLHLIASDAEGSVVGGAVGRTWGECCELQQLWVLAEIRGKGTGSKLLAAFEHAARDRGCKLAYLDTFSFQAPGFYLARGYVEVLRTSGFTGSVVKFTLHKRLMAPGTEA